MGGVAQAARKAVTTNKQRRPKVFMWLGFYPSVSFQGRSCARIFSIALFVVAVMIPWLTQAH
ncbi:MAG: hypothetical protein WC023_15100, partial [Rhodocyclaceae bacterium]